MLGFLSKLFQSKKEKDLKDIEPYVKAALVQYQKLRPLSDDQLRGKTAEFQRRLVDAAAAIQEQLNAKQREIEKNRGNIDLLQDLFDDVEKIKKERNKVFEAALLEILPEAFAVVKETCRRLVENGQLVVSATDFDRRIAQRKGNVTIDGDRAVWSKTWKVLGNDITWDMIHYDVQLFGGVVLHTGKIAEMATGEGKTLVSTLPAYLNGLLNKDFGLSCHLVTVNDYLARRDSEWNAPIFEFHQLTVDCIDIHQPNSDARRAAYASAIVYGTNNEFGFDYLRDNMVTHPEHLVQGTLHYAMIDEVDSVLIDEARTPLIIAGPVPPDEDRHEFNELKPRIEKLMTLQRKVVNQCMVDARKLAEEKKDKEAGFQIYRAYRGLPKISPLIKLLSEPGMKQLMQKSEAIYLADNSKLMHVVDEELYFTIDEKNNQIELTEKGREAITKSGEDPELFVLPDMATEMGAIQNDRNLTDDERFERKQALTKRFTEKAERLHSISQLLKAYTLFERDVEYIVDDEKVMIVDENTGRVLPGRRYSDGLHQAIEAKENVKIEAATQTYATVTLQNFFRMYHKLCGMTGTAETEAPELFQIYKLDVVVIPTNKKIVRKDEEDLVYKTKREKYNAIIDEINQLVNAKRPVLVGTTSVEVSELLSRMLKQRKIEHQVLNAKQHAREADIVAEAGKAAAVTIATNMAGRGTDIKLGPGVKDAGGLAIIGSERHESRRIDRQLRGRAGRQGDPGSSHFFVSLEDDLMRMFGSERIAKVMDFMKVKEGEVIQHSMITRSIGNAQKKVEENNFAQRKRLLEYDDVMNKQREAIYTKRRNALFGERFKIDLDNMLWELCESLTTQYYDTQDIPNITADCIRFLTFDPNLSVELFEKYKVEQVTEHLYNTAKENYQSKTDHQARQLFDFVDNVIRENGEQERDRYFMAMFINPEHRIAVQAPIGAVLDTKGQQIISEFEKTVVLEIIDEYWKDHLRNMDDLKVSVQTAHFEQKDPLVIYKQESFNLFRGMMDAINREVISTLFQSTIEGLEESDTAKEQKRQDFARLKAQHEEAKRMQQQAQPVYEEPEEEYEYSDGGGQPQLKLSRAERRKQERETPKKKR